MVDTKLTVLDAITDAIATDILYIVDDPGGTPLSKKIAVSDALKRLYSTLDAKEFGIDNVGDIIWESLMWSLNFECKSCHMHFDSYVGQISFDEDPPRLEKKPVCQKCGERTIEEVYLTEIGQGQLTAIFMNSPE